ncbi:MAG: TrkH family potassium uptake protein [Bacteroidota bacterium]|nr:TrkH family potassium uptake protein [Bacteroidota bacterium]
MNIKFILNVLGRIQLLLSVFMITILPWTLYFHEKNLLVPVTESSLISLTLGLLFLIISNKHNKIIGTKEAYITVSLSWITMGIIGSLPFILTHSTTSIVDALFESFSGFTTTGSSILTNIEAVPKSILYWRSLTHWIGGMGIIVLTVAVFPSLKIASYRLFSSETSGITSEKIIPRTSSMAKNLWGIYIVLSVLMTIILMFGGVNFYESLCHTFGTIATGGFSTKNASAGYYSPFVQYVIALFMLLSGINFTIHYFLLKGRLKDIFNNTELKTYLLIIIIIGSSIALMLHFKTNLPYEQAFRESFFQIISIITATGFSTVDYLQWNELSWILLFFTMFIGACVGSTGGGIKVIRHIIAFKSISRFFLQLLEPHSVKRIVIGGKIIKEDKIHSVLTFIVIYILIFLAGGFAILLTGQDVPTSFSASITCMGGIGPGIGSIGPASNFAQFSNIAKIILPILMIIGRLEILTFLVIFTPSFWKA